MSPVPWNSPLECSLKTSSGNFFPVPLSISSAGISCSIIEYKNSSSFNVLLIDVVTQSIVAKTLGAVVNLGTVISSFYPRIIANSSGSLITLLGSGFRSSNDVVCGMKQNCRFIHHSDLMSYIFFSSNSVTTYSQNITFFLDGLASGYFEVDTSKPSVGVQSVRNVSYLADEHIEKAATTTFCFLQERCAVSINSPASQF